MVILMGWYSHKRKMNFRLDSVPSKTEEASGSGGNIKLTDVFKC